MLCQEKVTNLLGVDWASYPHWHDVRFARHHREPGGREQFSELSCTTLMLMAELRMLADVAYACQRGADDRRRKRGCEDESWSATSYGIDQLVEARNVPAHAAKGFGECSLDHGDSV